MVDALRGFAVMAILLVHNLEHFIFPVYPENSPAWLNALDQRKTQHTEVCEYFRVPNVTPQNAYSTTQRK